MAAIWIRPTTEGDLPAMFRVQLAALGFDGPLAAYGPDGTTAILRHGFMTGSSLVAEQDGRIVGMVVGLERDGTWFLSELFVLPDSQVAGVGRGLLDAAMPDSGPIATVSTEDYRAQALYVRAGMTPRWPNYVLVGSSDRARVLPDSGIRMVEADPDDSEWLAWNREICGRDRLVDIQFLCDHWAAVPLWLERGGDRIGYAQVSFRDRGTDPVISPGRATLGPVGVRLREDARDCLAAIARWAASQPGIEKLSLDVPGPHPGLPVLLDAGFRIDEVGVFFASHPERFGDPQRYIPATGALY